MSLEATFDSRKFRFSKEKMLGARSKDRSAIGLDSPILYSFLVC